MYVVSDVASSVSTLWHRGNLHLLNFLNLSHPLRVFLLINERLYRTLTVHAVTLVPTCSVSGLCRVIVSRRLLRLVSLLSLFRTFLDLLLHLLRLFLLKCLFGPKLCLFKQLELVLFLLFTLELFCNQFFILSFCLLSGVRLLLIRNYCCRC